MGIALPSAILNLHGQVVKEAKFDLNAMCLNFVSSLQTYSRH